MRALNKLLGLALLAMIVGGVGTVAFPPSLRLWAVLGGAVVPALMCR